MPKTAKTKVLEKKQYVKSILERQAIFSHEVAILVLVKSILDGYMLKREMKNKKLGGGK